MKAGKGFLSLLIGGTIGGVMALLFAPKKGDEVRKDIKNNFDDIVNKTKDRSRELFSRSKNIIDDILKKSEELRSLSRKYAEGKYDGTVERIEHEINNLRTALFAAIDTYRNSRQRDKKSDELVNNIYSEFENEKVSK